MIGFASLLAIAVGAGASGCLNMWWDADIDAMMTRTAQPADSRGPDHAGRGARLRPDAVGRLRRHPRPRRRTGSPPGFLAFTIFFYVVVYSMWLKRCDAAEHRHRRRCRRLPADDRLCGGHRRRRPRHRASCSPSSSCGRRRISGRSPSEDRAITRRAGVPMMPDVAGERRDAAADPALHAAAGAARRCCRRSWASAAWSMAWSPRSSGAAA